MVWMQYVHILSLGSNVEFKWNEFFLMLILLGISQEGLHFYWLTVTIEMTFMADLDGTKLKLCLEIQSKQGFRISTSSKCSYPGRLP